MTGRMKLPRKWPLIALAVLFALGLGTYFAARSDRTSPARSSNSTGPRGLGSPSTIRSVNAAFFPRSRVISACRPICSLRERPPVVGAPEVYPGRHRGVHSLLDRVVTVP